MRTKDTDDKS